MPGLIRKLLGQRAPEPAEKRENPFQRHSHATLLEAATCAIATMENPEGESTRDAARNFALGSGQKVSVRLAPDTLAGLEFTDGTDSLTVRWHRASVLVLDSLAERGVSVALDHALLEAIDAAHQLESEPYFQLPDAALPELAALSEMQSYQRGETPAPKFLRDGARKIRNGLAIRRFSDERKQKFQSEILLKLAELEEGTLPYLEAEGYLMAGTGLRFEQDQEALLYLMPTRLRSHLSAPNGTFVPTNAPTAWCALNDLMARGGYPIWMPNSPRSFDTQETSSPNEVAIHDEVHASRIRNLFRNAHAKYAPQELEHMRAFVQSITNSPFGIAEIRDAFENLWGLAFHEHGSDADVISRSEFAKLMASPQFGFTGDLISMDMNAASTEAMRRQREVLAWLWETLVDRKEEWAVPSRFATACDFGAG